MVSMVICAVLSGECGGVSCAVLSGECGGVSCAVLNGECGGVRCAVLSGECGWVLQLFVLHFGAGFSPPFTCFLIDGVLVLRCIYF